MTKTLQWSFVIGMVLMLLFAMAACTAPVAAPGGDGGGQVELAFWNMPFVTL